MQEAGYRTGIFGKYLNGYPKGVDPTYIAPGWNDWRVGIDYAAILAPNYDLNENGALFHYGEEESAYLTDLISRQTSEFIQGAVGDGQPFFAYVPTFVPHGPAIPAPRHAGAFADATAPRPPSFNEADVSDKPAWVSELPPLDEPQIGLLDVRYRDRSRSLLAVNDLVAEVTRTLEASGALSNTYIFFLSDNGFHQGEHRLPAGKQSPYEESIRVPLIVRGPGVPAGVTVDQIALNIDLAPTLADFAGIAAPEFVDGRSLRLLLTTEGLGGASWRHSFLLELFVPTKERERARTDPTAEPGAVETDGESEGGVAAPPPYAGVRTADLLYVEYETGEREFYDLRSDPYQMDNLAASADAAVIEALAARLADLRGCVAAACRAAEEAAVVVAAPA